MRVPYIISAELDLPSADLQQIININQLEAFRENLDTDLRAFGKDTWWVDSGVLRRTMEAAVAATSLPVVSLDTRYVRTASQYLGVSRGSDARLNDAGYAPRAGYKPIATQLERVSRLGQELVVADDVVFSGEMISWLADELEERSTRIGAVVCGVAIQEGIDKLALRNIPVEATLVFDAVEDELCERDFAFVPGSGRRVDDLQTNALYFDSVYGKPSTWASIPPEKAATFCKSSLARNRYLLRSDAPAGNFLGYDPRLNAIDQLTKRMGEAL